MEADQTTRVRDRTISPLSVLTAVQHHRARDFPTSDREANGHHRLALEELPFIYEYTWVVVQQ